MRLEVCQPPGEQKEQEPVCRLQLVMVGNSAVVQEVNEGGGLRPDGNICCFCVRSGKVELGRYTGVTSEHIHTDDAGRIVVRPPPPWNAPRPLERNHHVSSVTEKEREHHH